MTNFKDLRQQLVDLIDMVEQFKNNLRPGDYSREVTCVKVDLGHVIRDLRRGETFLDNAQKLAEEDERSRWEEDMEAGAIG